MHISLHHLFHLQGRILYGVSFGQLEMLSQVDSHVPGLCRPSVLLQPLEEAPECVYTKQFV